MPDIIHLLPDSIANQIAAGEVVQRPASVVKELMENAVDAGATIIQLIVKDAGRTLVQVIDNGSGMSETDARLSLERHATSKIRTAEDLFTLRTMGFRGEALASIAAVSQFEMKTRLRHADLGTWLMVDGSEIKKQEPTACDTGTSISVKNLFFNIPARRNFLKSNPVEMRHILDEFQRVALSHPELAFTFTQGDERVYDLPPGKLSQRAVGLFGKSYQEQLAACKEETELVKVTGYVGRPAAARKTRGEQFIFVNQRFVRNNYLNHAVMSAYENLLPPNSFPFYILFLEIDPKHIDVNVHPTKTEIKFDDERAVYAVVRAAVRQALGAHNLTPALDYSANVNLVSQTTQGALSRDQYLAEQFGTSLNRSNLQNWEKLFEEERPAQSALFTRQATELSDVNLTPGERRPVTIFQLMEKYVVRVASNGLMVIDQQAAHERVLFERLLRRMEERRASSVQSLFPQTVNLSPSDYALLTEMDPELRAMGFQLEPFGNNTIVIQGTPAEVTGQNGAAILEGLLEQFKENQAELSIPVRENLARAMARRARIKQGQVLTPEEMQSLADELLSCNNPSISPDGSTTFFIFDSSMIERQFS